MENPVAPPPPPADRAPARGELADSVTARKAAAPPEVRIVLDDFMSIIKDKDERKRVSRVVASWLVRAHAAAHDDPATKRLARLVLGVYFFAMNMAAFGAWDAPYKSGLRSALRELGAPLGAAFKRKGLRALLGGLTLLDHPLVTEDRALRAAAGQPHALRSDIKGIVPVPAAWRFDEPVARQQHERVFIHVLVMMAMALNEHFHKMMREVLGPHVVAGEGVMEKGAGGAWRKTPVKGVARMECKRVTDHRPLDGCRPAANIDVMRVIGVCETAEEMEAVLAALGARFGGCGRVKNGFAIEDADFMFNLRTLMGNFVVDFCCTFGELAARPGVAELWAAHVERSAPAGGAPRGRWRVEAAEALEVLTGAAFAEQPVRFICEAQLLLNDVFQVRKRMHEPYKGYRADTCALLHADMLGETRKVEAAQRFEADGDTPLKKACRDGDAAAAVQLLLQHGAAAAERGGAFVVACAGGRGALLAEMPALGADLGAAGAAAAWREGWERAARNGTAQEMEVGVVEALVGLLGEVAADGGVDLRWEVAAGRPGTALEVAAEGGHALAVERLIGAGAALDLPGSVGKTPLIFAAKNGHDAVVALLLSAGAMVDLPNNNGATALFCAAEEGHDAVVARLLAGGAEIELADDNCRTPLFVAAQKGHEASVAVLRGLRAE